jgi:hypothetical protein
LSINSAGNFFVRGGIGKLRELFKLARYSTLDTNSFYCRIESINKNVA